MARYVVAIVSLVAASLARPSSGYAESADVGPFDLIPPRDIVQSAVNEVPIRAIQVEETDRQIPFAPGVQAAKRYVLASTGGPRFGLIVRASVVGSEREARDLLEMLDRGFFRQQNDFDESLEIQSRGALDELRWARLVYSTSHDEPPGSSYVYLMRQGRIVVALELAGPATEREGSGSLAGDELRGVNVDRSVALIVLMDALAIKMSQLMGTPSRPDPRGFEAFAKGWVRHGMYMQLDPNGRGVASWRVYKWCEDSPRPPCDKLIGNDIQGGGTATLAFNDVSGGIAVGETVTTNDAQVFPKTEVAIALLPFDRLLVKRGEARELFCGPELNKVAPLEYARQHPCGA